jgi:pimeloyl-ACP methyl ester carboxylesterase
MNCKLFGAIASVFLLLGILFPSSTRAEDRLFFGPLPVIFVHGGSGSGAQFESQAQRFTSNGYPASYIAVYEYDSTYTLNTTEDIWAGIDRTIGEVMAKTGAKRVDLVGHSLGTVVLNGYLNSSKERAAKVAHYVSIDGLPGITPPGGVPTLALWAGTGDPGRQIAYAKNVTIPNQTHVQCATSPESFAEMFRFLASRPASTLSITPEDPARVKLAGRAVLFPQNVGVQDATLEIWDVDARTGARLGTRPDAVYPINGDGSWGPFSANGNRHYEFALLRPGEFTHHFYFEPFPRSDYLIRLDTEEPGTGIGTALDVNDRQTDLIVVRYKEFWGDQGAQNDALQINGMNVVNAATCPIDKRVNAIFAFDKGADGISDVSTPIPFFFALPFITGVDLFVLAANPPDQTVSIVLTPRDGGGKTQVLNVANWPSLTDRVSLQFHEYVAERSRVSNQADYLQAD